jgi:uncharacterized protein
MLRWRQLLSSEGFLATSVENKQAELHRLLAEMGSALVAFSGGVDSAYLSAVAHDVLGDNAVAITAVSPAVPESEVGEAKELAQSIGIRHEVIESAEMESPEYVRNGPDRCYHCKTALFRQLKEVAGHLKLAFVLDGSNADDERDFRPGRQAALEHGIRSPLFEAGLTKQDIRHLSRDRGLPTWSKPSMACLASRIPYGTSITHQALAQIEAAEDLLHGMGFRQVRVRHHGRIARVEVDRSDMDALVQEDKRRAVVEG